MSGKRGTRRWLRGHVNDAWVREAGARGYRSRAALKLVQIDDEHRLLAPGARVVDLGAAPGGWTQVAVERTRPGGLVLALDRLAMEPVPGAHALLGDFEDEGLRASLRERLAPGGADLVLSDIAPNLTGVKDTDQARAAELVRGVIEFAAQVLERDGALLVKVFHGAEFDAIGAQARARFRRVKVAKPRASRARSAETYLLARGPMVYSDPDRSG